MNKEIVEILLQALNRPVEWRKGQAVYNYAHKMFPKLVQSMDVRYDCFYVDERIESFLTELDRLITKYKNDPSI